MKKGDVVICTRGNNILRLFIVDEIREHTITGQVAIVMGTDGLEMEPVFDLQLVQDETIIAIVRRIVASGGQSDVYYS